jgi:hypothetical protein
MYNEVLTEQDYVGLQLFLQILTEPNEIKMLQNDKHLRTRSV